MAAPHYTFPLQKVEIIHSATTYDASMDSVAVDVWNQENAIDTAQVLIADKDRLWYDNQADVGDQIKIYLEYKEVSATLGASQLRFDGWIYDITPYRTQEGWFTLVKARQIGRSVLAMLCGQEYGSESANSGLDTLQEIITDATDGIVPLWVNKILGGAANSGYSLGTSSGGTDYVAPIAGAIRYLYFPYKQVSECLNDVMDYVQAIKGAAAGPHWIVTPTDYLCVATVGAHEADPATLWPTWWNTNQVGSTIVVDQDMIVDSFTKYPQDANYVLYEGAFRRPVGSDIWSENNGGSWATSNCAIANNDTVEKVGSYCIEAQLDAAEIVGAIAYPAGGSHWSYDITKWGGKYNVPYLQFYCMRDANADNTIGVVVQINGGVSSYGAVPAVQVASDSVWYHVSLPLGEFSSEAVSSHPFAWSGSGGWADVDYVSFTFGDAGANEGTIYIDGLHFTGYLVRGAKLGGESYYKIKLITDGVAKDDTGLSGTPGTTDVGTMARMAKAELYRAMTTPIIGSITIPGKPSIMAGQLCHIHYAKTATDTFRLDADMRILEHHMSNSSAGFLSILSLTDDVTNGRPMGPMNSYNLLQKATAPEFQSRQISSIKARLIDITTVVLEESY